MLPTFRLFMGGSIVGAGETCPGKDDWKTGLECNILPEYRRIVAVYAK
jgi:hypothetical protein